MSEVFEVRDMRVKEKFFVDDEYLNGYSKLCGVNATLVYFCLCRHSDRHQESFPSVILMAEKVGISPRSVIRGIQTLIEWNIISKDRERRKDAKWLNNRYILLDKSVWKPKPSATQSHGSQVPLEVEPSATAGKSQVPHSHTKDTHKKDTHIMIDELSPSPFILKQEIQKLYDNKRRDLNIIGLFFERKGCRFETKKQYEIALRRHLKPAKELKEFSDNQILDAMDSAEKEYKSIYTLETLLKILTK